MWLFNKKYKNIAQLSDKALEEIKYESKLIRAEQQKEFSRLKNKNNSLSIVLRGSSAKILLTLINDATNSLTAFNKNAATEWVNVNVRARKVDIIDTFILMNVLKEENDLVLQLNRVIYSSSDESLQEIKDKAADLLLQLIAYVTAIDKAAKVDDTHSYTWRRFLNNQLFTYKFVKERTITLTKIYNKGIAAPQESYYGEPLALPDNQHKYTGKEIIADQVKTTERMQKARKYSKGN